MTCATRLDCGSNYLDCLLSPIKIKPLTAKGVKTFYVEDCGAAGVRYLDALADFKLLQGCYFSEFIREEKIFNDGSALHDTGFRVRVLGLRRDRLPRHGTSTRIQGPRAPLARLRVYRNF